MHGDVIILTDAKTRLEGAVELAKLLDQRVEVFLDKSSGADDRDFDGSDRHVQEGRLLAFTTLNRIIVDFLEVIIDLGTLIQWRDLIKDEAQHSLEEIWIELQWNVHQYQAFILDHGQSAVQRLMEGW